MSVEFLLGYAMGEKSAANSAQRARSIPSISGVSVNDMENVSERINRLVLLCAAMWSILEEGGATEEQLIARVQEIDAEDNVLDGRITAKPTPCGKCGTLVAPGLASCQFCGEPVYDGEPVGPFDTV